MCKILTLVDLYFPNIGNLKYIEVYEGIWGTAAPALPRSGARTGERAGTPLSDVLFILFFSCVDLLLDVYRPWEVSHVWGPLVVRVMTRFVKTYICVKVELGDDHG